MIVGTGLGESLAQAPAIVVHKPTPFGLFRGRILEFGGSSVLVVRRHASGHTLPPHRVNYRAMASGCQALGITRVFATAAVGTLREDWPVGSIIVPTDTLDATGRNLTLFDHKVVHRDVTHPLPLSQELFEAAGRAGISAHLGGTYAATNGPRYETAAEIRALQVAADVVGMTAASEAMLMAEAEVRFGLVSVVTNLATGLAGQPHAHGEVERMMKGAASNVMRILEEAVKGST